MSRLPFSGLPMWVGGPRSLNLNESKTNSLTPDSMQFTLAKDKTERFGFALRAYCSIQGVVGRLHPETSYAASRRSQCTCR